MATDKTAGISPTDMLLIETPGKRAPFEFMRRDRFDIFRDRFPANAVPLRVWAALSLGAGDPVEFLALVGTLARRPYGKFESINAAMDAGVAAQRALARLDTHA